MIEYFCVKLKMEKTMDFAVLEELGIKKIETYEKTRSVFFVKSLLAGLYLGLAMILSFTLGALLSTLHPVAGSIGFAIFFGLAFVLIVFLHGELFTGNVLMTLIPVFSGKKKASVILPMWSLNYLGNTVGVVLISALLFASGAQHKVLHDYVLAVSASKLSYSVLQVFLKSILCNFIVVVAGYAYVKLKSEPAKIMVMFLVVMAFVLPGLDHSIANIGTYSLALLISGSSESLGLMLVHVGIATVGNIIGGAILFAMPLYYVIKPQTK